MNRIAKFSTHYALIAISFIFMLSNLELHAQEQDQLYISKATDSFFVANIRNSDTVAIYGKIEHNGVFGTAKGAYILFMGSRWKNSSKALFENFIPNNPAASFDGGIFNFSDRGNGLQVIEGGYQLTTQTGPVFPNIVFSNPYPVCLDASDLAVLNSIQMDTGKVYLYLNTYQSLILGGGKLTPKMLSYNRNKFFVTGAKDNAFRSLLCYRNISANDSIVFPYGATANSYTPAAIIHKSTIAADYNSSVFNGVYTMGGMGERIKDSSFISKTWYVSTPNNAQVAYQLFLQHSLSDESSLFTNSRTNSFISTYTAGYGWDSLVAYPIYVNNAISPNEKPDADSAIYHWRILNRIIEADKGNYYTKRVLEKYNNAGIRLYKYAVGQPEAVADGSYNLVYKIILYNADLRAFKNLELYDNLVAAFPLVSHCKITALYAVNGLLEVNQHFDGIQDTLIATLSRVSTMLSDTLYVLLNIQPAGNSKMNYDNTALAVYQGDNGSSFSVLSNTASVELKPLQIKIPEGFSPDGDGINDNFVIEHEPDQLVALVVYNRWGNIVYQNNQYQNDWDGKGTHHYQGRDLEEGTYYLLITVKDNHDQTEQKLVKFITLKRNKP